MSETTKRATGFNIERECRSSANISCSSLPSERLRACEISASHSRSNGERDDEEAEEAEEADEEEVEVGEEDEEVEEEVQEEPERELDAISSRETVNTKMSPRRETKTCDCRDSFSSGPASSFSAYLSCARYRNQKKSAQEDHPKEHQTV